MTYWQSNDNYGQLLQCWALQMFLKKKGHEPFLVRFKRYESSSIKCKLIKILESLKLFLGITHNRGFNNFRSKMIVNSPIIYSSYNELKKNPPEADAYITGSDQVWNYDLTEDELKAFFLQFGDPGVKRIAYAPSIAHRDYPKELKNRLKSYLLCFDALSVRELSAADICNSLGFKAEWVLDPTLLLRKSDYLKLLSDNVKIKRQQTNKFIFIYSINYETIDDIPFDDIWEYSINKGLKVVVTPGSGYVPAKELFQGVEYEYSSIFEWIHNIASSEFIVTSSFHGIIFSIIFHKRFLYTPLKGKYSESNLRVLELLKKLGLESCVYNTDYAGIDVFLSSEIDWNKVDSIWDHFYQHSSNYLITNL